MNDDNPCVAQGTCGSDGKCGPCIVAREEILDADKAVAQEEYEQLMIDFGGSE